MSIFRNLFAGCILGAAAVAVPMVAEALPDGFQKQLAISTGNQITSFKFAPNGAEVFVAEKNGIVRVYDNIFDNNPTEVVNISNEVYDNVDHGLLGLEVHPDFPEVPSIFVFYSRPLGQYGARLKRIDLNPITMQATNQQLLFEGWCNNSTSHAVGDLNFYTTPAGEHYLFLTSGDFASPGGVDNGANGECGSNNGAAIGAFRSQLFAKANNGVPIDYNGTLVRLSNNELMSNNQLSSLTVAAYGLRNPFKFTVNEANGEVFITDVGWNGWEEVNHVPNPIDDSKIENFGWPCFEGSNAQGGYSNSYRANEYCNNFDHAEPFYEYNHNGNQAAATGAVVYNGTLYPEEYQGNVFFADYSDWWLKYLETEVNNDGDRVVKNNQEHDFDNGAPVIQLESGRYGNIFYLSYNLNNNNYEIWEIKTPKSAATVANNNSIDYVFGVNETISLNATSSYVASGQALYEWDLDADGTYEIAEDSGIQQTSFASTGEYVITYRVSDALDTANYAVKSLPIFISNDVPQPTSSLPSADLIWKTGDIIDVDGSNMANDQPDVTPLWELLIHHCAKNDATSCHLHNDLSIEGYAGTFEAPSHEYPSHLEARLTLTRAPQATNNWWNTGWANRRLVSIDSTGLQASNDLHALLRLTPNDIEYDLVGNQGASLRFVTNNGDVISHKVQSWNAFDLDTEEEGISLVWLEFPIIEADKSFNTIWMYYNNPAANAGDDNSTTFPEAPAYQQRLSVSRVQNATTAVAKSSSVILQPKLSNILIQSNPANLTLSVGSDEGVFNDPIKVIVGSDINVNALTPQIYNDYLYDYLSWSDGGSKEHKVVAPDVEFFTVTANYTEIGKICNYDSMHIRGNHNGWAADPMELTADCTWGINVETLIANSEIKFTPENSWAVNFGDNNNDGTAFQGGGNIQITGPAGWYTVTFNDETMAYTIAQFDPNAAPVVNAGQDQNVSENDSITLTGTSSDTDGTIEEVKWFENGIELSNTDSLTIDNITTGIHTYTFTATDNGGESSSDAVTVFVENVLPTATASVDSNNVTEGDSITLSGTGSDIQGEVTFSWLENGLQIGTGETLTINAVNGGTRVFTLVVTDDEAASSTDEVSVTAANIEPTAEAGENISTTEGTATQITGLGADAAGTVSYEWAIEGEIISNNAVASLGTLNAGTYTLTLTVTDEEGSTANDSVDVTIENIEPTANAGNDLDATVGQEITLTGLGSDAAGSVSYNWQGENANCNTVQCTFNAPTEGSYVYTLTVTDEEGASTTDTVTLNVTDQPPVGNYPSMHMAGSHNGWSTTATPMSLISDNTWQIELNLATGTEFKFLPESWALSFGDNDQNGVADNDGGGNIEVNGATGSYIITFNDETLVYTIVENNGPIAPIADAGNDQAVKVGTTVTLDGSLSSDEDGNIVSFAWDNGFGNGQVVSKVMDTVGTFTVQLTVTDNDSESSTDSVIINVLPNQAPTADAGNNQTVRIGSNVTLDGGNSFDVDGTISNYSWDSGFDEGQIVSKVMDVEGDFIVTLTVTDNDGETSTDSLTISVVPNQAPVANAGADQNVKIGEEVTLSASLSSDTDGNIVSYEWDNDFGSGETASKVMDTLGTVVITLTVTDNDGETSTDTVTIEVTDNLAPNANAGADMTVSINQQFTLDGSLSVDTDGSIVSYSWATPVWGAPLNGEQPIANLAVAGTHVITLTVTDDNGATSTDEIVVTVNDAPPESVQPSMHMAGSHNGWSTTATPLTLVTDYTWQIQLELPAGTEFKFVPVNWALSYGDNDQNGVADNNGGGNIEVNDGTATYTITFNDQTLAYSVVAEVGPQTPVADAGNDVTVKVGSTVNLSGSNSSDADGSIVSYEWSNGFGTGENVSQVMSTIGTFVVTLTVTDNDGQLGQDSVTVNVLANQAPVAAAGSDLTVAPGEQMTFDASQSFDTDGSIVSWNWANDIWDGDLLGEQHDFIFSDEGVYEVVLTVTDNDGATSSDTLIVTVSEQPPVSNHDSMHMAGSFNGWSTTATVLTLTGDYTWEIELTTDGAEQFKFVPVNWSLSYGDNDQNGVADNNGGGNINIAGAGTWKVTFNDQTLAYTITAQ